MARVVELRHYDATTSVMAGLVPAIHVLLASERRKKDVDAWHKVSRPGRPKGRTRVPGMTG
jgi:hypothetical protein